MEEVEPSDYLPEGRKRKRDAYERGSVHCVGCART